MTWKPIPDFSIYEASNGGLVRNTITGNISSPNLGSHGYLMVNMKNDDGKWGARLLHVIVASAFYGKRPVGMDCCHNDGDRLNNSSNNLRWDSRKANIADQKTHGSFGWRGKRKLSDSDIPLILSLANSGEKFELIANKFDVSVGTISAVVNGKNWKDVSGICATSNRRFHRGAKMRGVLNERKVLDIVVDLNNGIRQKVIAEKYDVKPQTISNINVGKIWGWLTGRSKE